MGLFINLSLCGAAVPQQIGLFVHVGVETHRGALYGVTTLSGVSNEDNLKSASRGARMALKDCSDNEAVRSTG